MYFQTGLASKQAQLKSKTLVSYLSARFKLAMNHTQVGAK
jgi:hypothetical protein